MDADSPLVEEIRRRRHALSARFGDDLDEYVKQLRALEAQHQSSVVGQIQVVPVPPAPEMPSTPSAQLADPTPTPQR